MVDYGTVEIGGTKTLVSTGSLDGSLAAPLKIATSEDAIATLADVVEYLRSFELGAVGIAAFGPLELRRNHPEFGRTLTTPKPGWSGIDVAGSIANGLEIPVGIDTDVNGAALAEGKWGASTGLEHHVYMTVGTGIGVGIVSDGEPLVGVVHPEMGHIPVEGSPHDEFPGSCRYHGRCLEGMASGPSLLQRFGKPGGDLAGEQLEEAVDLVGFYVAQGIRTLAYSVGPQRVVVGGGVSKMAGFYESLRHHFVDQLGGYLVLGEYLDSQFIVPPGLGDESGLAGGLLIAAGAVE